MPSARPDASLTCSGGVQPWNSSDQNVESGVVSSPGMPLTDCMVLLLSQIWNSKAHRNRGKVHNSAAQLSSASQMHLSSILSIEVCVARVTHGRGDAEERAALGSAKRPTT